MNLVKSILIITFMLLSTVACNTNKKIESLKPLPDYSSTEVVYEKQLSYINMPVDISMNDLQTQTNKYLNGLIYEDKNIQDDNLMLKVWKQAPIIVTEKNGKIHLELPLKVWTKVKYGVNSFGLNISDTKELNLNGRVNLSSAVDFKNWKLLTTTQIESINWTESPNIVIAGKSVPITYLVNPAINIFKGKLATMVDDAVAKSLDIKPYVLNAIESFSKPKKVNETYNSWFAMQPVEIYAAKPVISNKKLTINMGLKTYLESSVGREPALSFDKNAIALKSVEKVPTDFKINLAAFTPYAYASEIIKKNFNGQKFESGKRSVTVNNVELWGKEGKMIVAMNLTGAVNGDFYLTGLPVYDANTKEIFLDQVDFVLDSKSKLLKIADWLAHGLIVNKMAAACRFSIAPQLADGQKTLAAYLNNYEPIKGVKVVGTTGVITPNKIILTPNSIVAMMVVGGKVGVSIDGIE